MLSNSITTVTAVFQTIVICNKKEIAGGLSFVEHTYLRMLRTYLVWFFSDIQAVTRVFFT